MKRLYQFGIVLVLFVFLTPSVAACSPASIAVVITCRNGGTERIPIERAEQFLMQLPSTCDIGNDRVLVAREVQRWKDRWKGYFRGGALTVVAYDSQQEVTIQRANADLLSCWYRETKHIDTWLFIEETTRAYCHLEPFTPCCLCPDLRLSIFEFAIYLVSHLQLTSFPYLGVFASIIAGLALFFRRLVKQGEMQQFIRPCVSTVLLTVICAIAFIWWFMAAPIDIIGWIIVAYLLASIIMYVKKKYAA